MRKIKIRFQYVVVVKTKEPHILICLIRVAKKQDEENTAIAGTVEAICKSNVSGTKLIFLSE